ncbi:hypothetical protein MW887_002057 [Aspergillus wentii]|nr:hypothetical protein MW887_002057 [Aspergillus wentii]
MGTSVSHAEIARIMDDEIRDMMRPILNGTRANIKTELNARALAASPLSCIRASTKQSTGTTGLDLSEIRPLLTRTLDNGPTIVAIQNARDPASTGAMIYRDLITVPRYNSAKAICSTLLAELLHDIQSQSVKLPEMFGSHDQVIYSSQEEQFTFLEDLLLSENCPVTTWIVVNLDDQVVSHQWLLHQIGATTARLRSKLKVIFINSMAAPLPLSYPHAQAIDLRKVTLEVSEDKTEPSGSDILGYDQRALDLIVKNPQLYPAMKQLNGFFRNCDIPLHLHPMLVTWMETWISNADQSTLESKMAEFSPKTLVSLLLHSAVARSRDCDFAKQILDLLVLSFRPFRLKELADLEISQTPYGHKYYPAVDCNSFAFLLPGILSIDQSEIHLAQLDFRKFILSEDSIGSDFHLGPQQQEVSHGHIASLCLNYLLSEHGRELLECRIGTGYEDIKGPESPLDFLSYAVQYWPRHAKLAGNNLDPESKPLNALLRDESTLKKWAQAYWSYKPPHVEAQMSNPIVILAEHGLGQTLEYAVRHTDPSILDQVCSAALPAAAYSGENGVLQLVLDHTTPDQKSVQRALLASLRPSNEQIQQTLVAKALQISTSLPDLSVALSRAVSLGYWELVSQILAEDIWDNGNNDRMRALLQLACRFPSVDTVKCILERTESIFSLEDLAEFISQAFKYGNSDVAAFLFGRLALLIKEGDGNKTTDTSGQPQASPSPHMDVFHELLTETIVASQPQILRSLLDVLSGFGISQEARSEYIDRAITHQEVDCFTVLVAAFLHHSDNAEILQEIMDSVLDRGNAAMLRHLMLNGCVIDNDKYHDALQRAFSRGQDGLDLLKLLVEEGKRCVHQETYKEELTMLLRTAVAEDLPAIVEILLRGEPDLERKTLGFNSRAPLIHASYLGYVEIVDMLLKAGADREAVEDDSSQWRPIHAGADNVNVLRLLIKAKADINARAGDGSTPLHLAARWNATACVDELLKHDPVLVYTAEGESLLGLAVKRSNRRLVEAILDADIDHLQHTELGANQLLLHDCVTQNDADILKRLLLYDFHIDPQDHLGRTPLNCLGGETDAMIVRLLVHRGASPNTSDFDGRTPLSKAAEANNIQAAKVLLTSHADPNVQIHTHGTAIHLACRNSSLEMVQVLVNHGADLDAIAASYNGTVFQAACQGSGDSDDKSEILVYLLDQRESMIHESSEWWGCNLNTACLLGSPHIVESFIAGGADIRAVDRVGRSPIHLALCKTLEHVKLLQNNGANLLVQDKMHRNAAHCAVLSGHLDTVRYVLEQCPDMINAKDCDGWTPIFWALRPFARWANPSSERFEIINELISRGADILLRGNGIGRMWAPYQLAQYYGLPSGIVDLLKPNASQIRNIKNPRERAVWWSIVRHQTAEANMENAGFCDGCLVDIIGPYYVCDDCGDLGFWLCFKCYLSKSVLHPNHNFSLWNEGGGYESSGQGDSNDSDNEDDLESGDVQSTTGSSVS